MRWGRMGRYGRTGGWPGLAGPGRGATAASKLRGRRTGRAVGPWQRAAVAFLRRARLLRNAGTVWKGGGRVRRAAQHATAARLSDEA